MLAANARVLIVKLSSIGDVLHATATVHNLRLHFPTIHITWLVSPPASVLLEDNPDVDELLIWDRRVFDAAAYRADFKTLWRTLREASRLLSSKTFDVTIDLQGLLLTGILSRMSGAPRRIGIHERHEGNSLFMTELAEDTREPHKVLRYLTALRAFNIYDCAPNLILNVPKTLEPFAENFLSSRGIDLQKPILFVALRTTWETKNWSPDFYAQVLAQLPANVQIIFSGAKEDEPFIEHVRSRIGRTSLSTAGEVNLLELAALFKLATLLLTGDTGPLHMAEAVGLKTVSLWGATNPKMFGPLSSGHTFIVTTSECRFCCKRKCRLKTNACMNALKPEHVSRTLNALFDATGGLEKI